MKEALQHVIDRIFAGKYNTALKAMEAIPEHYALQDEQTMQVNAVLTDLYNAQAGRPEPFIGFFPKSAVWRLRVLQGDPDAKVKLLAVHVMAVKVQDDTINRFTT
jgi:hypothetical protein